MKLFLSISIAIHIVIFTIPLNIMPSLSQKEKSIEAQISIYNKRSIKHTEKIRIPHNATKRLIDKTLSKVKMSNSIVKIEPKEVERKERCQTQNSERKSVSKKIIKKENLKSQDSESNYNIIKYNDLVRNKIKKVIEYPYIARLRGFEGKVVIKFDISLDGKVSNISFLKKSKYEILNKAALITLDKAVPFPPLPKGVYPPVKIQLPITFSLTGSGLEF